MREKKKKRRYHTSARTVSRRCTQNKANKNRKSRLLIILTSAQIGLQTRLQAICTRYFFSTSHDKLFRPGAIVIGSSCKKKKINLGVLTTYNHRHRDYADTVTNKPTQALKYRTTYPTKLVPGSNSSARLITRLPRLGPSNPSGP